MGKVEEMEHIRYHNDGQDSALSKHADELMIANFIKVLTVGSIYQLMTDEEKELLRTVVKNHAVLKGRLALEAQKRYLGEEAEKTRSI